jgi:hypothetical protein
MQQLQLLTKALVDGTAAPAQATGDPRNGVSADQPPFPTGVSSASAATQPTTTQRLQRATFAWQGGPKGFDMPLGRAFVSVQRVGAGTAADDLGLQLLWKVDGNGANTTWWEVPRDAVPGAYRFVVTGNHYRLVSHAFTVTPATTLSVQGSRVRYPDPVVNEDLTFRPAVADGASLKAVDGAVAPGQARDEYGNCNGGAATTSGPRAGSDLRADPAVCAQAAARPVPTVADRNGLPATGALPWTAALGLLLLAAAGLRRVVTGRT